MLALATRLACCCLALTVTAATATAEDTDWPLSERLLDRFAAGRYDDVVRLAPDILRQEPEHDSLRRALADSLLWTGSAWAASEHYQALLAAQSPTMTPDGRLKLADALAWTGRMAQSLPHYTALLSGPLDTQGRLGLANAQRWLGRDDLALPQYHLALQRQPEHALAQTGALFASRALRPRTQYSLGYSQDNSPMQRPEQALRHTWRNDAGTRIFTLETSGGHDQDAAMRVQQHDLGVQIEDLALPLAPRLELAQQTTPQSQTFGRLRLQLSPSPVYLHLGRVNWGKTAFNATALHDGLSAQQLGLEGKLPTAWGEVRGFANHFHTSDDNTIVNGDGRITPWGRPWGPEIRLYVGTTWRFAAHTEARYWSPGRYVAAYVGLEGEWQHRDWSVFAAANVGTPLAKEAASYWSTSLTAKRWLGADWGIAVNAWAQSNAQGSDYRAHGLTCTLEKLW